MHVEKHTKNGLANLIAHYDRRDNANRNYENKNIDKSRTYLNYDLQQLQDKSPKTGYDKYKDRISKVYCMNRKDVNTMVSIVVTLPKDYDGDPKTFFKNCKEFFDNRYGKDNCIGAYVHMDEVTPHMHYIFIPVVKNRDYGKDRKASKDYEYRVNAKQVITKFELQKLHPDLEKFLQKKEPDRIIHIMTGEVAKNKQNIPVQELKLQEQLKQLKAKEKELDNREQKLKQMEKEITEKSAKAKEELRLQDKRTEEIKTPEGKKTLLHGKTYTQDDMDRIVKIAQESQERELKAKQALHNVQYKADNAEYHEQQYKEMYYKTCNEFADVKETLYQSQQTLDETQKALMEQNKIIKTVNKVITLLPDEDRQRFLNLYNDEKEKEKQRQKQQQKERERNQQQRQQRKYDRSSDYER